MTRRAARVWLAAAALLTAPAMGAAHDGPPYPIVTDRVTGPYLVSVWTDPDTTDDGTPGGQFWVMLARHGSDEPVPPETRATVEVHPIDRPGPARAVVTEPVRREASTQFGAVVMDHEGRFAVTVALGGPLGDGRVDAEVDATYDLRPPPFMLVLYLVPFVVVGLLWTKLLLQRRRGQATSAALEADGRRGGGAGGP